MHLSTLLTSNITLQWHSAHHSVATTASAQHPAIPHTGKGRRQHSFAAVRVVIIQPMLLLRPALISAQSWRVCCCVDTCWCKWCNHKLWCMLMSSSCSLDHWHIKSAFFFSFIFLLVVFFTHRNITLSSSFILIHKNISSYHQITLNLVNYLKQSHC